MTNTMDQLFVLNIPEEYTLFKDPSLHVIVRTTRKKDGSKGLTEFLNLNTLLVTSVKDWLLVWSAADKRADVLWNEENKKTCVNIAEKKLNSDFKKDLSEALIEKFHLDYTNHDHVIKEAIS